MFSVGLFPQTLSSHRSPTFLLTLDASTSIPVALVDLSSSISGSQSLDYIVGKSPKGPPGKFYREQFALALINTLRTGGHSARVVPTPDAWDNQKLHFERFRARLDEGELVSPLFILYGMIQSLIHSSSLLWRAWTCSHFVLRTTRLWVKG